MSRLPKVYRALIANGMTEWGRWYFIDDKTSISAPPDLQKSDTLQDQFRMECNAGFDVYLFARVSGSDDFAFFYVDENGQVQDSVHWAHLGFSSGPDELTPKHVVQHVHRMDLMEWLRDVVVPDLVCDMLPSEED